MRHPFRVSHRSSAKPSFAGKTKLAALPSWGLHGCLFLVLVATVFLTKPAPGNVPECSGVEISGECIALEYADTNKARALGLSDRAGLYPSSGMLFVFDNSKQECMWMKDMHFAIDIIWLDKDQSIIKIMENVAPSTFPESFCADDTQYVLELNANEARRLGLTLGQQIKL